MQKFNIEASIKYLPGSVVIFIFGTLCVEVTPVLAAQSWHENNPSKPTKSSSIKHSLSSSSLAQTLPLSTLNAASTAPHHQDTPAALPAIALPIDHQTAETTVSSPSEMPVTPVITQAIAVNAEENGPDTALTTGQVIAVDTLDTEKSDTALTTTHPTAQVLTVDAEETEKAENDLDTALTTGQVIAVDTLDAEESNTGLTTADTTAQVITVDAEKAEPVVGTIFTTAQVTAVDTPDTEESDTALTTAQATAADTADIENTHNSELTSVHLTEDVASQPIDVKVPIIVQAEEVPPPAEAVSVSADDLRIPARYGVNASTSSNGFDEAIGIQAFVPISQEPGDSITFFEGDLEFQDGDPSFSLNLGYRGYNEGHDLIRGGYIGVDGRTTDESTFFQVATGYERIGRNWEFRINGYIPIGKRTNTIQNVDIDTGLQTSSGFQGNQLVLSAVQERQHILQEENALGGFDAEFGTQLDAWAGGELMGYIGGYLLSGEESSLGGQLRLAANFESNFNAGLSLQHDGLFGTSVAFSISVTWPNFRFHDDDDREFQETYEVLVRMRDPIARRRNVAINVIEESEIFFEETVEALRNPEEEEDYRFLHVDLAGGTGTGDGTYETPFGAVEDAIALVNSDTTTYSDGNTIIYVDGENASTTTIPGFTIPDRVRVLSQGPEQIIAGMPFPGFPSTPTRLPFSTEQNFNVASDAPNANGITVSLPDSNDGVFPTIAGGTNSDLVVLGDNTILAGFQIDGAAQHGVTASEVDNVELRNNLITNSGSSGVFLDNVGGSAILFDNVITNSGDRGLFVQNNQSDHPIEITIAGFDLDNNRVGMEFSATATAGVEFPEQIITIGPSTSANTSVGTPSGTILTNSILNNTDEGLIALTDGNDLFASASQQLSASSITIDTSGSDGVQLLANVGAHQQEFTIDNSVITNSVGNGITIVNGAVPTGPTEHASAQEVVILNSEISNSRGNGIDVMLSDAGAQELVIQNNQIINNVGDGIRSLAQNVSVQEWRTNDTSGDAGINNNTISGNGGQAIVIELENLATLPILGIENNTLSDNVGPDIEVNTSEASSSPSSCLVIAGNVAPLGIQITGADPDPFFSGTPTPNVLVQDLASLIGAGVVFQYIDFFGNAILSTDPFENETNGCIQ